ncbi:hypothetical protein LLH06_18430 [Mucilaginibacter daejeonensis]|uniref:DUF6624 domain-containing protein n=1 Tax=Mucilaginibacter daejeonensis TaxID=398049 RepID=UPI001D17687D|nr:DUF6624 domain-containing protein [Mucilaginibacter daejeonensis]UEG52926.1 hypothetical protein LLH06_18430 [Mucilaginibacter daejeonensis]
MRTTFTLILSAFISFVNAQHGPNLFLKRKLDSILMLDQRYREAQVALSKGANKDSIARMFGRSSDGLFMFLVNDMQRVDSLNMLEVEGIIKKYGYPGASLVGTPTNEVAWNVIQHSPHIKDHIELIRKAAAKKEIPFTLYAKMQDRLLMDEGKEQVYGTQIYGMMVPNKSTGKKDYVMFVWPVKDPANIDRIRLKAGFDQPIAAYARTFGVTYKRYTLAEVESLKKQ